VCVSSELEEILKISERIAVTAGGQFAGEVACARAVFKANCDKCAAACSAKAEICGVSIRSSARAPAAATILIVALWAFVRGVAQNERESHETYRRHQRTQLLHCAGTLDQEALMQKDISLSRRSLLAAGATGAAVAAASAAEAASFGNPDEPAEGAVNVVNPKALNDPGPQDPNLANNQPAFLIRRQPTSTACRSTGRRSILPPSASRTAVGGGR
jgi:hypothetical protein